MENLYLDLESARHSANLVFLNDRIKFTEPGESYRAIVCKSLSDSLKEEIEIIFDTLSIGSEFSFNQDNIIAIDILNPIVIDKYITSLKKYSSDLNKIGYSVDRLIDIFINFKKELEL